jgi:peptide/nickel transport system substrate-binding protein
MLRGTRRYSRVAGLLTLALLVGACAAPIAPPSSGGQTEPSAVTQSQRTKSLTFAITAGVQAMGVMGNTTTAGGWMTLNELHSNGLITSDVNTRRPIGRLAEQVPTLDDGSITLLPDGRMRVIYHLRKDVTWQDGAPFDAQDLVFSFRLNTDSGVPTGQRDVVNQMDSVEAPDSSTFVLYFKGPYYLGGALGVRPFWPQPRHILGDVYERYLATKNSDELINHPYWTSEYVHLGPFRLTSFDPAAGLDFKAYDGYFLGRPKIDIVHVRAFNDHNTLFSNLLAGTVDMTAENSLNAELGFRLKDQWEASGQGTVTVRRGNTWFLVPQWRPAVQTEPANLDPRVRAALYQAIDRETLSEALQGGARDLAAWSLLPPGHQFYDATKDTLRRYAYDPERARATLRDLGWAPGPDGILRNNADGRHFHNAITTVPGRDTEIAAMADYWRRIGIEVDEITISAAQVRDSEFRALYPSYESTAQGSGDSIFGRMDPPPASAATRWVGERGGFEDQRAWDLIKRYRTSLSERDQLQAMQAINDYVVSELPLLILFFKPEHLGVRKGVVAYDDLEGGMEASQPFGTYTRNAHLWDIR